MGREAGWGRGGTGALTTSTHTHLGYLSPPSLMIDVPFKLFQCSTLPAASTSSSRVSIVKPLGSAAAFLPGEAANRMVNDLDYNQSIGLLLSVKFHSGGSRGHGDISTKPATETSQNRFRRDPGLTLKSRMRKEIHPLLLLAPLCRTPVGARGTPPTTPVPPRDHPGDA